MQTTELHIDQGYLTARSYAVAVVAQIAYDCWADDKKFVQADIVNEYGIAKSTLRDAIQKCQQLGFFSLSKKRITIDQEAFNKRCGYSLTLPLEVIKDERYTWQQKLYIAYAYTMASYSGKFTQFMGLAASALKCSVSSISRVVRQLKEKSSLKKYNTFITAQSKSPTSVYMKWEVIFKDVYDKYAHHLSLSSDMKWSSSWLHSSMKFKSCIVNAFKRDRKRKYLHHLMHHQEIELMVQQQIQKEEEEWMSVQ